jgi:hypothetical protein
LLNRAALGRYPIRDLEQLFPDGFATLSIAPPPAIRLPGMGNTLESANPSGDEPGFNNSATGSTPPGLRPTQPAVPGSSSYSPLQMALAAATISSGGVRPAPHIVAAVDTPQAGWVPLDPLSEPVQALDPAIADQIAVRNAYPELPLWGKTTVIAPGTNDALTWYLGGTLPGESEPSYSIAVVLEEQNPQLAEQIGMEVLSDLLKFSE